MGALLQGGQRYSVSAASVIESDRRFASVLVRTMYFVLLFRYMVDAADRDKIEPSRNELHNLLDKPQLQGIPV